MTLDEFKKILETDPRFRLKGKSISATLYESPLDNLYYDDEDNLYIVMNGETVEIPRSETADFLNSMETEVAMALQARRIKVELFLNPENQYAACLRDGNYSYDVSGLCYNNWLGE